MEGSCRLLQKVFKTSHAERVCQPDARHTEIHCSKKLSGISDDAGQSKVKPHGYGICDETFKVEKEFMELCYHHYCVAAEKDTFLESFESRLLAMFL